MTSTDKICSSFTASSSLATASLSWHLQMRVLLNASALSGVCIFTVANIMGMNLGSAPDRLAGNASFDNSPLIAYPLFLTVRHLRPDQFTRLCIPCAL